MPISARPVVNATARSRASKVTIEKFTGPARTSASSDCAAKNCSKRKDGMGSGFLLMRMGLKRKEQLAQHLQGSFTVDWKVKDAWPYLKAVPWHSVVEANRDQYETAELRAMVSIPHMHSEAVRCTFPARLAIFVQNWVLGLEMEVRQADYRLKQLLGTDSGEIEAGKSFDWLNRATVIRYSRTLAALVLFVCHLAEEGDRYSVDFEAKHDLGRVAGEFQDSIMAGNSGEEATELLLSILSKVIEFEGTLADTPENQYIVFHFLALRHLRPDGGFPPPVDVTQALAHLQ
ncbi:hypothetical protein NliqN6_5412, partial [Naganishia liquefaciens]